METDKVPGEPLVAKLINFKRLGVNMVDRVKSPIAIMSILFAIKKYPFIFIREVIKLLLKISLIITWLFWVMITYPVRIFSKKKLDYILLGRREIKRTPEVKFENVWDNLNRSYRFIVIATRIKKEVNLSFLGFSYVTLNDAIGIAKGLTYAIEFLSKVESGEIEIEIEMAKRNKFMSLLYSIITFFFKKKRIREWSEVTLTDKISFYPPNLNNQGSYQFHITRFLRKKQTKIELSDPNGDGEGGGSISDYFTLQEARDLRDNLNEIIRFASKLQNRLWRFYKMERAA